MPWPKLAVPNICPMRAMCYMLHESYPPCCIHHNDILWRQTCKTFIPSWWLRFAQEHNERRDISAVHLSLHCSACLTNCSLSFAGHWPVERCTMYLNWQPVLQFMILQYILCTNTPSNTGKLHDNLHHYFNRITLCDSRQLQLISHYTRALFCVRSFYGRLL